MIAVQLLICLVSGILWADRGGRWPHDEMGLSLLLGLFVLLPAVGLSKRDPPSRSGPGSGEADGSRAGARARSRGRWVARAGLVLAGLSCFEVGWTALSRRLESAAIDADRAAALDAREIHRVEARVVRRQTGRWGDRVLLDGVVSSDPAAPPLPGRLQLHLGERFGQPRPSVRSQAHRPVATRADRLLRPGAHVRLGLRIQPMRGRRNPGLADPDRRAARRGLAARARLVDPDWVVDRSPPAGAIGELQMAAGSLRARLRDRVAERWAGLHDGSGLARALALGDRHALEPGVREAFQDLGLAHLLAISGLHVALVGGFAAWLALASRGRLGGRSGRIGGSEWSAFLVPMGIGCLGAMLYGWLGDAGVSVVRACALLAIAAGLRLVRRNVQPPSVLALVAALILAREPATLFDLGTQLSFGSCLALWVAGIWRREAPAAASGIQGSGAGSGVDPKRSPKEGGDDSGTGERSPRSRVARGLCETMRVSLVVSLGTAGILAAHGIEPSGLGPLVNGAAIPWMAGVALPGALLALVWTGLMPGGDGWDEKILGLLLWPAAALGQAAEWIAACDFVEWMTSRSGGLPTLAVAAIGLFGLGAARAGRWRMVWMAWSGLTLFGVDPGGVGGALGSAPRVVFFDMGQGDATLVQGPDHTLLIDAGPGSADGSGGRSLVRSIRALGLRSIDTLALTHADLDHRGGAGWVLERLGVDELWLPVSGLSDPPLVRLAKRARERGARVRWLAAGDRGWLHSGAGLRSAADETERARVEVLWPPADGRKRSRNEGSLVLAVELEGARFLFTADVGSGTESALLRRGTLLRSDVLKVAHHGSRSSTSSSFLEAVSPRLTVLSAPCEATRGLPSPDVLARLRASGARLLWTGRDGAVAIETGRAEAEPGILRWASARRCGGRGKRRSVPALQCPSNLGDLRSTKAR